MEVLGLVLVGIGGGLTWELLSQLPSSVNLHPFRVVLLGLVSIACLVTGYLLVRRVRSTTTNQKRVLIAGQDKYQR